MKLAFFFLGLTLLFGQSLFGQIPALGSFAYRLVKTVEDADFDYQLLEYYFSDKKRLDAPTTDLMTVHKPMDAGYTLLFFLGDLVCAPVDDSLRTYFPAALDKQQLLVLKVNSNLIITDGFLFPCPVRDLPLSETLFRVRTKGLQLKTNFTLEELNLRNLYANDLRAAAGKVFVSEELFYPEVKAIAGLPLRYNLVKKVDAADFNYVHLDDVERYDKGIMELRDDVLDIFEPVAGDFTYYKFIAEVVVEGPLFPEEVEERDSLDALLATYESPDSALQHLVVVRNVLILKTDATGIIVDGYGSPADLIAIPASASLLRLGHQAVHLRDGMPLQALGLTAHSEVYGFSPDTGNISLFPK